MALIRDTRPALAVGVIRILDSGWLPSDQCILAVVDGASIRVREPGICSLDHTAVDREGSAAIVTGGCALEFINRAELCDRTAERLMHGGQGQSSVRVNCQVANESTV